MRFTFIFRWKKVDRLARGQYEQVTFTVVVDLMQLMPRRKRRALLDSPSCATKVDTVRQLACAKRALELLVSLLNHGIARA